MAAIAIQSPSGTRGANTWTQPISTLAIPATVRPMQKARNAGSARPARCVDAAIATTSTAATIIPADESDSDHGMTPKIDAASASIAVIVKAPISASAPGERGQADLGTSAASTIRKPPQPTNAAA